MRLTRTHTKFLSLFVVAFLCLNAGGILCLTYCTQAVQAKADHCPLKKQGAPHCPSSEKKAAPTENNSFEAVSVKCCLLPVSIFAAPLENTTGISVDAAVAANIEKIELTPVFSVQSRQIPKFYYRPPPNDGQFERVRNQVFRI
jgi:hypothetical protein